MKQIKITDVRSNPGDAAFLIDVGNTAIMYDSGFAFSGFDVADNIKNILGDRSLDYIFLTHSHYDHACGSAYAAKYWPDVKVVAGEYASKIFSKATARTVMRDLDKKAALLAGVDEYIDLIDELKVDIPVSDGDVIRAGDMEFVVMDLPGHTKCSVGYYCPEEKLLLSCETIGVYNGVDDVVPSYLVGYDMTIASIQKVKSLDIERVLIPHYGLIEGEEVELYLAKAQETAQETAHTVADMLKQGRSRDEIIQFFKDRFYQGYIREIYPVNAMELNTGITIDLIEREFGSI